MMQRVATLNMKQYREYMYRLSAINSSGKSIKNRGCLLEFKDKFDKS